MVVLLHVSHFCCPLFYDYSTQTHVLTEQSIFDDNGEGIEGPLFSGQEQRDVNRKNCQGSWGRGRRGRGREIFPLHFSSVRATRHYIQPTCISERLVWNSLNQYKLSLVFILDRAVDTSTISIPNVPSPGFVILQHKVMIFSPNAYRQDKFRLDT